jgi:para-nitrobenzyl esterase
MQRAWLDFAAHAGPGEQIRWSGSHDWPVYDSPRRATRVILSARDVLVEDPDAARRTAWTGLY